MELEAIMLAGVAATEKFVAEGKALDNAWRAGTMDEHLKTLREREISEYTRDDSGNTGSAGPA